MWPGANPGQSFKRAYKKTPDQNKVDNNSLVTRNVLERQLINNVTRNAARVL